MTATAHDGPRRTNVVAVRLTDDEHAAWTAAAADVGRRQLGRWIRERITADIAASTTDANIPDNVASELPRLRRELTAAGNNLNQIARALNASPGVDANERKQITEALQSHRSTASDIRDLLRGISS